MKDKINVINLEGKDESFFNQQVMTCALVRKIVYVKIFAAIICRVT